MENEEYTTIIVTKEELSVVLKTLLAFRYMGNTSESKAIHSMLDKIDRIYEARYKQKKVEVQRMDILKECNEK